MTNEPLKHALEMATALLTLLTALIDDDGSDDDSHVLPLLNRARQQAQDLVNTLQEVVR